MSEDLDRTLARASLLDRRRFLQIGGVGVAAATSPSWLAACATAPNPRPQDGLMQTAGNDWFDAHFGVGDEMIRKVLSAAMSRGGDFADLYFQHSTAMVVGFEDDTVNEANTSVDLGVGIRVVVGDQTGYAFTEELSERSMVEAAKTAAGIAAAGPVKAPGDLTRNSFKEHYDVGYDWHSVGVTDVRPMLERINARARELAPEIVHVKQYFVAGQSHVMVVDSMGRKSLDSQPMTRIRLNLVMDKGGKTQSNGHNLAAREGMAFYNDERIERLITTAIDRTRILFDSGRPPAGEMPVVLAAGSSGILLHEAIGHGMEADFNRKGISIFSDLLNKKVAEDEVTIVDDGTNAGMRGSINFDDEGNPSQATTLVENGMLRSYMHDRISALHYGVKPTGSGRRQSFRHVPLPRMRNTYMKAGPHPKEALIASVKDGIYCISFTNGQVNIGAGDYSFYVKNGYRIQDGKLTEPIKDINIIGNGPESLARITMVGDDFEMDESGWTCGKDGQSVPVSLGMPSVLVSGIVVGGKAA